MSSNMREDNRTNLLEFRDFGFQYLAQAEPTLFHINLTVRKGEKILILGPSGCGKSTIANCINGLIPFSYRGKMTGSVLINGKETSTLSLFAISRTVGTVLQDSDGQFIGLTVAEDIAFALENDGIRDPELHDRVKTAAKLVGVQKRLTHAPGDLSGGQKQKTALAGVMVTDVELLIFDEPLANLDPAAGKQAMELIREMCDRTGAAAVIIEHRVEDVLHIDVDRIVLMGEGRILADLPPDRLLAGTLLADNGIREPLYLTALKYAGVAVTEQMCPRSIHTLRISETDKAKVCQFVRETKVGRTWEEKKPLVQAKGIRFSYENGCLALDGVTAAIKEKELVAIVGNNGAGKSTFAKVICGFETPQEGEISFDGVPDWEIRSIKEKADLVGFVMQNPNQMISSTMIFDEVSLGLRARKVPEEEIRKRTESILQICGLWPFRYWPVSALSFGQKKRVTIASILVLDPKVIILDEPTAGQDYRHYTEIMEFLKSLAEQGISVVMITHDMHLMMEYASRAIVFSDGRVIADDICANILTDKEIVEKASLKETSLYTLGKVCGIDDPRAFVRFFIDYEREVVGK